MEFINKYVTLTNLGKLALLGLSGYTLNPIIVVATVLLFIATEARAYLSEKHTQDKYDKLEKQIGELALQFDDNVREVNLNLNRVKEVELKKLREDLNSQKIEINKLMQRVSVGFGEV